MNTTLRPATAADRPFVEATYFETQRAIIEQTRGWRGDERESLLFDWVYDEDFTQIILVDDREAGFLSVLRYGRITNVQCLFLRPEHRCRGIGTQLLKDIIAQAASEGTHLTIGTERINPAKRLYLRLGFVVVEETEYRIEFAYPDTNEQDVSEPVREFA